MHLVCEARSIARYEISPPGCTGAVFLPRNDTECVGTISLHQGALPRNDTERVGWTQLPITSIRL